MLLSFVFTSFWSFASIVSFVCLLNFNLFNCFQFQSDDAFCKETKFCSLTNFNETSSNVTSSSSSSSSSSSLNKYTLLFGSNPLLKSSPSNSSFHEQTFSRYSCHCDSYCFLYGDCCPDPNLLNQLFPPTVVLSPKDTLIINVNDSNANNSKQDDPTSQNAPFSNDPPKSNEQIKLERTQFTCSSFFQATGVPLNIFTVNHCSKLWSNYIEDVNPDPLHPRVSESVRKYQLSIRRKCEQRVSLSADTFLSVPIFSLVTGITYKNIFCAVCNEDVSSALPWSVESFCDHSNAPDNPPVEEDSELDVPSNSTANTSTGNSSLNEPSKSNTTAETQANNSTNPTNSSSCTDSRIHFKPPSTFFYRPCVPIAMKECPSGSKADLKERCFIYNEIMFGKQIGLIKNRFCAECNNLSLSNYECEATSANFTQETNSAFAIPFVLSMKKKIDENENNASNANHSLEENGKDKQNPNASSPLSPTPNQWNAPSQSFPHQGQLPHQVPAYSLILDIDFTKGGSVVGTKSRCPPYYVYDPWKKICRLITCDQGSMIMNNHCVSRTPRETLPTTQSSLDSNASSESLPKKETPTEDSNKKSSSNEIHAIPPIPNNNGNSKPSESFSPPDLNTLPNKIQTDPTTSETKSNVSFSFSSPLTTSNQALPNSLSNPNQPNVETKNETQQSQEPLKAKPPLQPPNADKTNLKLPNKNNEPNNNNSNKQNSQFDNPISYEKLPPSKKQKETEALDLHETNESQTNMTSSSSKLMISCPRLTFAANEYIRLENGSVRLPPDPHVYTRSEYSLDPSTGQLSICAPDVELKQNLSRKFTLLQQYLTVGGLSVSIVSLLINIIICTFKVGQRSISHMLMLWISGALLVAQVLFLFGVDQVHNHRLCFCVGISMHYAFLCSFCITNVLMFDISRAFSQLSQFSWQRGPGASNRWKSKLIRYALYGFAVPALIVGFGVLFEMLALQIDPQDQTQQQTHQFYFKPILNFSKNLNQTFSNTAHVKPTNQNETTSFISNQTYSNLVLNKNESEKNNSTLSSSNEPLLSKDAPAEQKTLPPTLPVTVEPVPISSNSPVEMSWWQKTILILAPKYGYAVCWISNRKALLALFAVPLAIILLINFLFYLFTAHRINQLAKASKLIRQLSQMNRSKTNPTDVNFKHLTRSNSVNVRLRTRRQAATDLHDQIYKFKLANRLVKSDSQIKPKLKSQQKSMFKSSKRKKSTLQLITGDPNAKSSQQHSIRRMYQNCQQNYNRRKKEHQSFFVLYVKLALMIGCTWVIGFVAAFANSSFLWCLFIICNSLQGFFILFAYNGNLLKNKTLAVCHLCKQLLCHSRNWMNDSNLSSLHNSSNKSPETSGQFVFDPSPNLSEPNEKLNASVNFDFQTNLNKNSSSVSHNLVNLKILSTVNSFKSTLPLSSSFSSSYPLHYKQQQSV